VAEETLGELELRDYLRVVRRRKWTIALVTIVVVGAAIGLSLIQTPVYRATAEVLLQAKSSESLFDPSTGNRNDPARAIQTEMQVLRSRPVRDLVEKKLGSSPKVSAAAVGQTDVIAVSAESTDPDRAAAIANAYATSYIEFRRSQSVDDLLSAAEQIQQKITDLQKQIDALAPPEAGATRPGATPSNAATDNSLQRESLQQQQALFRQKLDQTQVDAALKSGGAQLVTPAIASTSPVRPTPKRNAIVALAVGLMLGVGLAFLREYLDDRLKSKEDVEQVVPGVPVLGLIPALGGWKDKSSTVVVSISDPKSPAAEAYRSLRTSVQFIGLDRSIRTLQITSPAQSEGKSTTIANLAVALAGAGQRVVIVDADLRRPRIHDFFGLDHAVGLTSVLIGDVSLARALLPAPGISRLHILPSGPIPPNPSELLASDRAADVFRTLGDHADIVLIDCPPVLPVTDATVLAHRIDATLLVVHAGHTEQRQLKRAAEMLAQVDAPLLGVVLNGVADESAYGYKYSYRYAYAADQTKPHRLSSPGVPATTPIQPPTPAASTNGHASTATPAPVQEDALPRPPRGWSSVSGEEPVAQVPRVEFPSTTTEAGPAQEPTGSNE
jgi:succinoglycan biosynthesis transport protein ExoP